MQVEWEIDACFEESLNVTQRLNSRGRRRNCAEDHVFRLSPSSSLKTSTFPVRFSVRLGTRQVNYAVSEQKTGPTGFYWAVLDSAGLCWALLDSAGLYWSIRGRTWLYRALLDFTWLYWMGDSGGQVIRVIGVVGVIQVFQVMVK